MKYYRVRSERSDWFNNYHTRAGELFTEKEHNTKVRYIADYWFETVNVSRRKTRITDGRRFEITE